MNMITTPGAALCLAILSGCVGTTGGTVTEMATATTAIRGVMSAPQPPSEADLALSCSEVNTRTANLYARFKELDAAQRKKQRKQAAVNGVINLGTGILGGVAAAGAGTVNGVRAAASATTIARGSLMGLAASEGSAARLKDVNDTTLIATRISQLEKVKFEKGC